MLLKHQSDLRLAPALSFDLKAERSGQISGYASTFGGEPDRVGDIVTEGAFRLSLKDHQQRGTLPAMLWAHQIEAPIGKWLTMEEDAKGLYVVGTINLKSAAGREAFGHVEAGDVGAFSIGYTIPEGGRRYLERGAWALDRVDLAEVSVVSVPANPNARISAFKQLGSKSEAVDFLRAAGLPKAAAQRFAAGGFAALSQQEDTQQLKSLADLIEQATTELRNL